MKSHYLIIASALAAAAVSCSKEAPRADAGGTITFSAGEEATKGLIYNSGLSGSKTRIGIYDLLSTGEYHISPSNPLKYDSSDEYWVLDGKEGNDAPKWVLKDSEDKDVSRHSFFGWLATAPDGTEAESYWGSGFTLTRNGQVHTLTIPAKTVLTESVRQQVSNPMSGVSQMDFCYTDVVNRTTAAANYSTVNLSLKHLFTSFRLSAKNYNDDVVVLKNIYITGLKNSKSATITFDSEKGESKVEFADAASTLKIPFPQNADDQAICSLNLMNDYNNGKLDIQLQPDPSDYNEYIWPDLLIWPQTLEELTPDKSTMPYVDDNGELSCDYGTEISDPMIIVVYSEGGGDDLLYCAPLPNSVGWDAGTRHLLQLLFYKKKVELKAETIPWDYVEQSVAYSVQVTEGNRLSFKTSTCTVDAGSKTVYFKGGNPITCYFKISQPTDATWLVSKSGDFDAFEIDNVKIGEYGDGEDTAWGTIDGSQAEFTIYPTIVDPKRDYKIHLTFDVRTSSTRVINADEAVQGSSDSKDWYTIVLQGS